MMPQGFLAVSSHPSSQLPIEEFHEWYEEEHIPLRLNHIKDFSSGARYKLASRQRRNQSEDGNAASTQTSWLALYTVTSPAVFFSDTYQDLRINRSHREKNVMSRIEVLTRITGEIIGTYPSLGGEEKTTGFKPGRPSGWVVTHGIKPRDIDRSVSLWASKIEQEVAKYRNIKEDWARTFLVLVHESGVSRFAKSVEADDEVKMPYFAVHEFKDGESAESFTKLIHEFVDVGIELGEGTIWELYKAYPCLAHG